MLEDYGRELEDGDSLHVSCYELEFSQSLTWESDTRKLGATLAKATVPAASASLLSRLRGRQAQEPIAVQTEAQQRAEEAKRAADAAIAQMEQAHAAKEASRSMPT
ncbi:MAG: hypothetical protein V3U82_07380 [Robiginitomaculum sp.]